MSSAILWWPFEVRLGIDKATSCFVLETNDRFMELKLSFVVSVFGFVSKEKEKVGQEKKFHPSTSRT